MSTKRKQRECPSHVAYPGCSTGWLRHRSSATAFAVRRGGRAEIEAVAICRPDLSLPLAIPLGRVPISVVLERVARESFLRRPDERVAAHTGGGDLRRPLLRFVRAPPGPRRRLDPPIAFVVHQLVSTFESSPISSSGVHSGGSRIAIRALQMDQFRDHHLEILLSPLRGFGSWMAPNPGA